MPIQLGERATFSSFSERGSKAVLCFKDEPLLRVVDLQHTHSPGLKIPLSFRPQRAVISSDGRWVAASGRDLQNGTGVARIWSTETGAPTSPPLAHMGTVESIEFSPDRQFLATTCISPGSQPAPATLWRVPAGEPFVVSLAHRASINALSFSADGRLIATASVEGLVKVWKTPTGTLVGKPFRHRRGIISLTFSPDGGRLLTSSIDRTARIWDERTGDPISPSLNHDGGVNAAEFSPDGERVATASSDRTVRLWDVAPTVQSVSDLEMLANLHSGRSATTSGSLIALDSRALVPHFQRLRDSGLIAGQSSASLRDENWHASQAIWSERTHDWRAALFHLEQLIKLASGDSDLQFRRSRALAEIQRWEQGGPEAERFYPPRRPGTPPRLIDLSRSYNAPLFGNWNYDVPDLRSLPLGPGVVNLAGVDFDIRGIIQAHHYADAEWKGYFFPANVTIPVRQKASRIHFLQGFNDWYAVSTVAQYRLRFATGATVDLPLARTASIAPLASPEPLPTNAPLAWKGRFPTSGGRSIDAALYRWTWENSLPNTQIDSIEIKVRNCGVFILGITLE
jgi:WD40 repeat protein